MCYITRRTKEEGTKERNEDLRKFPNPKGFRSTTKGEMTYDVDA